MTRKRAPDPRKGTMTSTRVARGERPRGKARSSGGRGRPPENFEYTGDSVRALRDAGRKHAARCIPKLNRLWELQVDAGVKALEAIGGGSVPTEGPLADSAHIGQRQTTVQRSGDDKGSFVETRTEYEPFAGLHWNDVNRAAENLADRSGYSRKSEVEVGTDELTRKLWNLNVFKGKDGTLHELSRRTADDSRKP